MISRRDVADGLRKAGTEVVDLLSQASHGLTLAFLWILERVAEAQSGGIYLASTVLVALAGAYFGAIGAQKAINSDSRNRRRREALMALNSAQSLTTVIFNQAAALKKQHHLPLLENWKKERARVVKAAAEGVDANPIAIHMQTPPPILFPIAALADLINGKLTLNGRPLGALAELFQAEHTLKALGEAHNAIRKEFERESAAYVVPRYLALETNLGQDNRYRDICFGFVEVLDDLLFFSEVLSKDLLENGQNIIDHAPRRERKRLPKLNVRVGIVPGNEYLVPHHEHHQKWYDSHIMIREPKKKWFRLPCRASVAPSAHSTGSRKQ